MHLLLLNLLIHLQYWALEALGKSAYRHVTMVISSQLRRLYVPASVFWLLWKAIGPNKCVPRALLVPPQQHKSTSSNSLLLGLLAHFPNWEALRFLSALLDTYTFGAPPKMPLLFFCFLFLSLLWIPFCPTHSYLSYIYTTFCNMFYILNLLNMDIYCIHCNKSLLILQ